jgi:hypothetical protein
VAQLDGGRGLGLGSGRVLDQVAVEALAVADRRLQRDRLLDELQQVRHALGREARLGGELLDRRLAIQLLGEHAALAEHAPDLVGDVDGNANRPALVGERAGDGLADPPGGVGRELEAEPVVELLDCADQPQVALLDQIQERHAGLGVVPGDGHDEPQVGLDELPLRLLVALVLPPGELALLGRRQQAAVADLANVELQRVVGRAGRLLLLLLLVLVLGGRGVRGRDELERRAKKLDGLGIREGVPFHGPLHRQFGPPT